MIGEAQNRGIVPTSRNAALDHHIRTAGALFGRRLSAGRAAIDLSRIMLAERTGISVAYIAAIEAGYADVPLDMMVLLASGIKTEAWEMLAESE